MAGQVLIIGGSGLIGNNCMKVFSEAGWGVTGTHFSFSTTQTVYFDTLNIENETNFSAFEFKPTHIIHTGALTHVDKCELEPQESYRQTVLSTKNLIGIAKKFSAQFVYISTDYVFDGKNGPYSEEDETNPLSIYGKHKFEAEQLVLRELPESIIVRVTNVYGDEERGKNFIARLLKACETAEKLELNLPIDQYATPANAYDIARAILLLIENQKSGIYNIASTDYLNRLQLAQKVFKHFPANNVLTQPMLTEQLNQPAARPLRGGLRNEKFSKEFPDFTFSSVDDYLYFQKKKK